MSYWRFDTHEEAMSSMADFSDQTDLVWDVPYETKEGQWIIGAIPNAPVPETATVIDAIDAMMAGVPTRSAKKNLTN